MARISVFLSSTKPNNNGLRVFSWLKLAFEKKGHSILKIDPLEHPELQVFKERYDKSEGRLHALKDLSDGIKESDAIILLVAEYNHGYTGALKNALDTFHPEYKNKPFGIISYSTGGFGGVRAATQVRAIIPGLGGILLPKTIAISKVREAMDEDGKLLQTNYDEQIIAFMKDMEWHIRK